MSNGFSCVLRCAVDEIDSKPVFAATKNDIPTSNQKSPRRFQQRIQSGMSTSKDRVSVDLNDSLMATRRNLSIYGGTVQ
jgi:hypothetical protein